ALSYGMSTVDGDVDQFTTDITQYQLSLYGSYNFNHYFIDAQVGMGTASYKQERAYIGNQAKSNYDGDSLSAGMGFGYVWSASERTTLTPYARLNYISSSQDAYTETSNLSVGEVSLESTQASVGTEFAYAMYAQSGVKWQPRLFLEYAQELGDEEVAINSQYTDTFANGTTGYAPELGAGIFRTGAGLSMMGSENGYNISIDYKFETRDRYTSHGLILNGKLFF
ncbi:MAG: autotransporter outer membrane beta-barrel domain-containing protein, partial [Alphaproteobacteria bacterium]|nr:autotransporter outer membrane beta-barrel domain-containing protein [Alphaproteobacteria bacterium]